MDVHHEIHGVLFKWNARKAVINLTKHGVGFENAATVFFDPFIRLVDASRHDEARDAGIGFDGSGRLLYVVHIERENDAIRIISARRATQEERMKYELE